MRLTHIIEVYKIFQPNPFIILSIIIKMIEITNYIQVT